jgi:ATP-dependent DNA helicase RecG
MVKHEHPSEKAVTARVETPAKPSENTSGKPSGKTSDKILTLIARNPAITIAELALQVKRSSRAVELSLEKLKSQKRLIRIGAAHGGHWEVAQPQAVTSPRYQATKGPNGAKIAHNRPIF